jgi:FkbM family methyltransferase
MDGQLKIEKGSRFLNHIRQRTVIDRMAVGVGKRRKQKRANWWNAQKGKRDYYDVKVDRGVRIRLHFDSELARLIYVDDFERTEREFLKAYLKPGDIFVDVGANIGLFSLIAARLVGPSGKVIAYEPARKTYEQLLTNVELNRLNNVQCFQLALSNKPGELPLHTSVDGFDAWNSFAHPIGGKSFRTEITQCVKWDEFADTQELIGKVSMMKIDVEGWESRVLEGARESFSREDAPLLQVEFTEEANTSAGFSCAHLYHLLEDLGYQMFIYDPTTKQLIFDSIRESYPYINLIATKNPQEANLKLRESTSSRRLPAK